MINSTGTNKQTGNSNVLNICKWTHRGYPITPWLLPQRGHHKVSVNEPHKRQRHHGCTVHCQKKVIISLISWPWLKKIQLKDLTFVHVLFTATCTFFKYEFTSYCLVPLKRSWPLVPVHTSVPGLLPCDPKSIDRAEKWVLETRQDPLIKPCF